MSGRGTADSTFWHLLFHQTLFMTAGSGLDPMLCHSAPVLGSLLITCSLLKTLPVWLSFNYLKASFRGDENIKKTSARKCFAYSE